MIKKPNVLWCEGWFHKREAIVHPSWIQIHGGRPPAWFIPCDQLHDKNHPSAIDVLELKGLYKTAKLLPEIEREPDE